MEFMYPIFKEFMYRKVHYTSVHQMFIVTLFNKGHCSFTDTSGRTLCLIFQV